MQGADWTWPCARIGDARALSHTLAEPTRTRGCGVKEALEGASDSCPVAWLGDDGRRWIMRADGRGESLALTMPLTAFLAIWHCEGEEGRRCTPPAGDGSRIGFIPGVPTATTVGVWE